jgi:uncharacterized membrane protein HdeD (DUF308 family)
MSDLTPRRSGGVSRRRREERAYRLVQVGGAAGVVAVVGVVLAILGVISFAVPFFAAVVAAVCAVLFRRIVGRT